jgi:aspartate aminotransferase-like enzyme
MKFKDRIFAPGPTSVPESSRLALSETNPYHRTSEFSAVISGVESKIQRLFNIDWSVVPLSASGTGGMQMAVDNLVEQDGTALVVESGKFGKRWTRMLENRGTTVITHEVDWGDSVDPDRFRTVLRSHPEVRTVYATLTETSTLVRHPIQAMGECIDQDTLFVVDAISGLAADPFEPVDWGVDAFVAGSQKGLMAPPGLSFLAASDRSVERSRSVSSPGTYFDLPDAVDTLRDAGQTPWTPSMNLLRATSRSLDELIEEGIESVIDRHDTLARVCRASLQTLGLESFAETPSNAGTAFLTPDSVDADELRNCIQEKYGVFFPGGQKQFSGRLVRVGHLGHVDYFELLTAIGALELGLAQENYIDTLGHAVRTAQQTFEAHQN